MKALVCAVVLFSLTDGCHGLEVIAQWDFNSRPTDANTKTGTLSPRAGSGTAFYVGGTAAGSSGEFATGDTRQDPAGSTDNSAWLVSKYPSATNANKTAGVEFDLPTTDYENISIQWCQQNSGTASRYARFQYTTDGVNFTDLGLVSIFADQVFTNQTFDLSSLSDAANNPSFGFRLVAEFESTACGAGTNAYVATKTGSQYGAGGTVRFDMVTVSGTLMPGANTPPRIEGPTNQVVRVMQSTAPLSLSISDNEDPPDWLVLQATSSDPAVIPEANIAFARNGSDCTVTVTAGDSPGMSVITLSVIDSGGKTGSAGFAVTVLPANTAPSISTIPSTNTPLNTSTVPIPFTVGDLETASAELVMSAVSANPVLLPNDPACLVFSGSGSNRTLTLIPAVDQAGVAPVRVTVSDGANSTSTDFALLVPPAPGVIFYDPFGYADGSLLTNSGFLWKNRSGTYGQCQVVGGQLQIATNQTEDVVAPLIGAPYARSNGTVLYASFKVNLQTPPKVVPSYFAHFASGSTLRGRIFAGATNSGPGSFRLLVSNGTDGTTNQHSRTLNTNTTYIVVTRYEIDSASTTLWVDPVAESDPSVTATDPQTAVSVTSYAFRQDSSLGAAVLVGDLKVGLSFQAVLANSGPDSAPLTIERSGENVILRWTNSVDSLQFAPAVEGPFANVPGAQSPFIEPLSRSARFYRLRRN